MQSIRKFFWMCTGTPVEVIEKYPTEHNKFIGIGATIFFTALFAAISGGYALYYVFAGAPLAIFFAVVFGILWDLRFSTSTGISFQVSTRPQKDCVSFTRLHPV